MNCFPASLPENRRHRNSSSQLRRSLGMTSLFIESYYAKATPSNLSNAILRLSRGFRRSRLIESVKSC